MFAILCGMPVVVVFKSGRTKETAPEREAFFASCVVEAKHVGGVGKNREFREIACLRPAEGTMPNVECVLADCCQVVELLGDVSVASQSPSVVSSKSIATKGKDVVLPKCVKCGGSGTYTKSSGTVETCWACRGKGTQTPEDCERHAKHAATGVKKEAAAASGLMRSRM